MSKLKCYDCGRLYGDSYGFPDLVVPHDIWLQISPTGHDGGLLCPCCIAQRCEEKGIQCSAKWTSGPFCDDASSGEHSAAGVYDRLSVREQNQTYCIAVGGVNQVLLWTTTKLVVGDYLPVSVLLELAEEFEAEAKRAMAVSKKSPEGWNESLVTEAETLRNCAAWLRQRAESEQP